MVVCPSSESVRHNLLDTMQTAGNPPHDPMCRVFDTTHSRIIILPIFYTSSPLHLLDLSLQNTFPLAFYPRFAAFRRWFSFSPFRRLRFHGIFMSVCTSWFVCRQCVNTHCVVVKRGCWGRRGSTCMSTECDWASGYSLRGGVRRH